MKTSRDWVVTFWLILLWTWVYKYFFEIKLSNYFLEGVYLEVKLHHIIILFLVFKETTVLLFTVVAGYTFPLTMHKGQRSVFFNPHWCQYLFPSFLSALLLLPVLLSSLFFSPPPFLPSFHPSLCPFFPTSSLFFFHSSHLNWRRQWRPSPVLLPGKSHGWRSLVGCSPWGR